MLSLPRLLNPAATPRLVILLARWLKPRRVRMYAVVLIAAEAVFYLVAGLVVHRQGYPLLKAFGQDFIAPYSGGRFFIEGRMAEIYEADAMAPYQSELVGLTPAEGYHPFINPPFAVLLFAPYAVDGYVAGLVLYYAVGLAMLVMSGWLFHRVMQLGPAISVPKLLGASLLFYPTLAWLLFAQYTGYALLIYTAVFLLLRRQRDLAAGLALGLLLYKPQLAIGLGWMLLIQRRWRALLGAIVGASLWVAAGLVISPEAMLNYLRLVPRLMETQIGGSYAEHSLAFFGILLVGGAWKLAGSWLAVLLTIGGLSLLAHWWWAEPWRPATRRWDLLMAATFAVGLLVSPHLYMYDLMLLLLPLAIVWSHYRHGTQGRALDGGSLLVWSAGLWAGLYGTRYLTDAQLQLTSWLGLPAAAVQLSTLIVLGWAVHVRYLAQSEIEAANRIPAEASASLGGG